MPIKDTIQSVPGYPSKLVIFKLPASPFYWVRYYVEGKILKRSTKTDKKNEAIKFAKTFYEDILVRQRTMQPLTNRSRFEQCARELLEQQKIKIERGELAPTLAENDQYRLDKDLLPFFRQYDVTDIDYDLIDRYLAKLAERNLASASLKIHLSHLKKILKYAMQKKMLPHLPAFPTIKTVDEPRGYFNSAEYSKLHNKAKALIGTTFQMHDKNGKLLRNITVTQELYDLILFMTNTFVRPTDIRVLQNKHVEIVRSPNLYLRLSHQTTKKHSQPMVSMEAAVPVFERLLAYQKERGYGKPDDYIFQPEHQNREYALVQLRRQYEYLLEQTSLKKDVRGEPRTMYSLRHTAIMFRLLNSDGLDLLTLARNSRTSVEMIERFYAKHLHGEMNVEKRGCKNFCVNGPPAGNCRIARSDDDRTEARCTPRADRLLMRAED